MALSQMRLFDDPNERAADAGIDYLPIHVNKSTFKAGLAAKVHRWFRLTPSFGPDLVRTLLDYLNVSRDEVVLDPFAGASTTLIEARLEGRRSFGYEINPLLSFVGRTSLNWSIPVEDLLAAFAKITELFTALVREHGAALPQELPFALPTIHNATRWWRPDVLCHLVLLREAIRLANRSPEITDFFRLALAGVLVPDLTNVTLGRLQLHFINRDHDDIQVWSVYEAHVRRMLDDYEAVSGIGVPPDATLLEGDSVTFAPEPPTGARFDVVITSPPYPNRYSYVWNTRPHLYMLEFFSGKHESSALDIKTIGGTWGTATSMLKDGILSPYNTAVEEVIGPVVADIRRADNLMANYCVKYFNLLAQHFLRMRPYLSDGARLAYVVGCSRLKGVYIETDSLLKALVNALGIGLKCDVVVRFRRRHSGKDLHESAVIVRV
jgi:hypothetical protein